MAGLLMSRLGVELQPDNVAPVGNIPARHYQLSRPWDAPTSISSWRFSSVTSASRS
jgi:hypothetical protein